MKDIKALKNYVLYVLIAVILVGIIYIIVSKNTKENFTNQEQSSDFILGTEEFTIDNSVMSGTIMAYYSPTDNNKQLNQATIDIINNRIRPFGWVVCDGKNGTPNLLDKFILGAGQSTQIGMSGGSNTITLTQNNLPAHKHDYFYYTNPSHRGDDHSQHPLHYFTNIYKDNAYRNSTMKNPNDAKQTLSTEMTGSGTAINIMPPYTAMVYIMKL
jgi:microcystin-dependent protein